MLAKGDADVSSALEITQKTFECPVMADRWVVDEARENTDSECDIGSN